MHQSDSDTIRLILTQMAGSGVGDSVTDSVQFYVNVYGYL